MAFNSVRIGELLPHGAGLLSEEIWRLNEDRSADGRRETADAP